MRKAFLDYLAHAGVIERERVEHLEEMIGAVAEPIGTIAFSYGMLSGDDIDEILDAQRTDHRPFGEIAVDKGMLTSAQVDTLLQAQQLRAASIVVEALALSGLHPFERLLPHLGQFLMRVQSDTPVAS